MAAGQQRQGSARQRCRAGGAAQRAPTAGLREREQQDGQSSRGAAAPRAWCSHAASVRVLGCTRPRRRPRLRMACMRGMRFECVPAAAPCSKPACPIPAVTPSAAGRGPMAPHAAESTGTHAHAHDLSHRRVGAGGGGARPAPPLQPHELAARPCSALRRDRRARALGSTNKLLTDSQVSRGWG